MYHKIYSNLERGLYVKIALNFTDLYVSGTGQD